jgi:hypothetical protein
VLPKRKEALGLNIMLICAVVVEYVGWERGGSDWANRAVFVSGVEDCVVPILSVES